MGEFVTNENGLSVNWGDIPGGVLEDFKGVVYYFQTFNAASTKEHNEAIEPFIDKLLSKNETNYTSWEVSKRATLVYKKTSQVTVVSFRVRDAY